MPSSDSITIPKVMKLIDEIKPTSILDIGMGNGQYGFLFRQKLDMDLGRINKNRWETQIDGVEIESRYISPIHDYIYDHIFINNWLDLIPSHYDLIFMGDVLEHFEEGKWQQALIKAKLHSDTMIVVCPNWAGSIAQGSWGGNKHEAHRVELSPANVGGKCVWANTKAFITVYGAEIGRDVIQ